MKHQTKKGRIEIIIAVDLDESRTYIGTNGIEDRWIILKSMLEGIGVTMAKLIEQGEKPDKVYKTIQEYLSKVAVDYKILNL